MSANQRQVGGDHYQSQIQHWDYVIANNLDYFQAQITKYVTRWKKKGGIRDLEKALHFLEKYIEVAKSDPEFCYTESLRKEEEAGSQSAGNSSLPAGLSGRVLGSMGNLNVSDKERSNSGSSDRPPDQWGSEGWLPDIPAEGRRQADPPARGSPDLLTEVH